jgi:hypothetical protein
MFTRTELLVPGVPASDVVAVVRTPGKAARHQREYPDDLTH